MATVTMRYVNYSDDIGVGPYEHVVREGEAGVTEIYFSAEWSLVRITWSDGLVQYVPMQHVQTLRVVPE